jgi:hypothetical protein
MLLQERRHFGKFRRSAAERAGEREQRARMVEARIDPLLDWDAGRVQLGSQCNRVLRPDGGVLVAGRQKCRRG